MDTKKILLGVVAIGVIVAMAFAVFAILDNVSAEPDFDRTPDYDNAPFKFNGPDAKNWDPSKPYLVKTASVQVQNYKNNLQSGHPVTITLVVGESTVSESSVKQDDGITSWKGPEMENGSVRLNWRLNNHGSTTVRLFFELSSIGAIQKSQVLVKVKATAEYNGENLELERTFTFNIVGEGSSYKINTLCTGGVAHIYSAKNVDDVVSDGDNDAKGRINTAVEGDLIRISPFPSTNGMIKKIEVKKTNGETISLTEKSYINTTALTAPEYWYYFFTMPNSDVVVEAEFNSNKVTVVSENGTVAKKLVANFLGPVFSLSNPGAGAGYNETSKQVIRNDDYFFDKDVVELTPNPSEGYVFKEWVVTSGDVSIEGNRFTMGESPITIQAVFEQINVQPPVPEVSSLTCSGVLDGSNVVLTIQIDGKTDVTSMRDPRLFITMKYGEQGSMVINYYSKPVLANGIGTDVAIVSAYNLNQVVIQLVDGTTNGLPADNVCWCEYKPTTV